VYLCCKTSLQSLSNFRISFIRRQTNNIIHKLAQLHERHCFLLVAIIFYYIPFCIATTLLNETVVQDVLIQEKQSTKPAPK
jgi:TRAP-type mannitol/chloroaromatic compound transport system permease small subunit